MTEELWRKEQDEFNKNVEKNTPGATEFYLSEEKREKSLKIKTQKKQTIKSLAELFITKILRKGGLF